MRTDKWQAIILRRSGHSYNSISRKLGISKSTLSDWFAPLPWSRRLGAQLTRRAFEVVRPQLQIMADANKKRWLRWRLDAREEAKRAFRKYRNETLFCSGVMIYWGEGDRKPKNPVRVSNVDPNLLRIFVKFLKRYGGISSPKIKAHMILYPDLDEATCRAYWSRHIGVAPQNFYRTQRIIGRHKTARLGYGIGAIAVSSRQLKEKILEWIELYSRL